MRSRDREEQKEQVAKDAAHLLNEAIRKLLIPQHLFLLFNNLQEQGTANERYASAVRHAAITVAIIEIFRLKETRNEFLVGWLFSDAKLRELGLPPLEEFVGDWKSFEMVRHQYAAHAIAKRSKRGRPARAMRAKTLGEVLRRSGLLNADEFLLRVKEELVPGVEKVRDEIFRKYPAAREFIEKGYASGLAAGLEEDSSEEHKKEEKGE